MALDEELLARAQAGDTRPVLRLYAWNPPAVSIGRFQDIGTAVNARACERLGFDIVRRVTGGRAVLHWKELTYSIAARTDDRLFPSSVLGTYKVIATALVSALRALGLPAEMVSRAGRHAKLVQKAPKAASCFSTPSWYEIVVNGRKIVGSAQRRAGNAFLQHGSILLEYDAALESEVIPGVIKGEGVTSLIRECRDISLAQVSDAVIQGFQDALGIQFSK